MFRGFRACISGGGGEAEQADHPMSPFTICCQETGEVGDVSTVLLSSERPSCQARAKQQGVTAAQTPSPADTPTPREELAGAVGHEESGEEGNARPPRFP